jgi:hypothetical protein
MKVTVRIQPFWRSFGQETGSATDRVAHEGDEPPASDALNACGNGQAIITGEATRGVASQVNNLSLFGFTARPGFDL